MRRPTDVPIRLGPNAGNYPGAIIGWGLEQPSEEQYARDSFRTLPLLTPEDEGLSGSAPGFLGPEARFTLRLTPSESGRRIQAEESPR